MSRKFERISHYKPRHRDILPFEVFVSREDDYHELGRQACYTGNPVHKKSAGDFALHPSSSPRPDKTLCDKVNIFHKIEASRLLKEAFKRGLISQAQAQNSDTWPKYVWAITDEGYPVEGAYDGQGYHGYPLPDARTPLYEEIVKRWEYADQGE
jgi:hypothetical protein